MFRNVIYDKPSFCRAARDRFTLNEIRSETVSLAFHDEVSIVLNQEDEPGYNVLRCQRDADDDLGSSSVVALSCSHARPRQRMKADRFVPMEGCEVFAAIAQSSRP